MNRLKSTTNGAFSLGQNRSHSMRVGGKCQLLWLLIFPAVNEIRFFELSLVFSCSFFSYKAQTKQTQFSRVRSISFHSLAVEPNKLLLEKVTGIRYNRTTPAYHHHFSYSLRVFNWVDHFQCFPCPRWHTKVFGRVIFSCCSPKWSIE